MSTLKVSAIRNAAAGSGGLVLAADGNVSGAGMDLIVSQSFSAVSSVSVDDCFSADYDNYRVMIEASGSGSNLIHGRMRASGTDDVSSVYSSGFLYSRWTASPIYGDGDVSGGTAWTLTVEYDIQAALDFISPAKAAVTSYFGGGTEAAGNNVIFRGGKHATAAAYDGLTIYPAAGTITGTLRVYGYRN